LPRLFALALFFALGLALPLAAIRLFAAAFGRALAFALGFGFAFAGAGRLGGAAAVSIPAGGIIGSSFIIGWLFP
jgi:hypothetical protein